MTLQEFVEKAGSQEKAAREIGVSFVTLNGWLTGKHVPGFLARQHLDTLGIELK